jgi:hypothetical protein
MLEDHAMEARSESSAPSSAFFTTALVRGELYVWVIYYIISVEEGMLE